MEIKQSEDYDFFDDGRTYSFVELERIMAKMFGLRIKVKRGRGARRKAYSPRHPKKKTLQGFAPKNSPSKAQKKVAVLPIKRP